MRDWNEQKGIANEELFSSLAPSWSLLGLEAGTSLFAPEVRPLVSRPLPILNFQGKQNPPPPPLPVSSPQIAEEQVTSVMSDLPLKILSLLNIFPNTGLLGSCHAKRDPLYPIGKSVPGSELSSSRPRAKCHYSLRNLPSKNWKYQSKDP